MRVKSAKGHASSRIKERSPLKKFIYLVTKILTVFFIIFSCIILAIVGGAIIGYIHSAEPLTAEDFLLKGFTSKIYDSKGSLVMSLYTQENREPIDSRDIPKYLKDAFVAIEDKRFYKHHGIDFVRIGNAVWSQLVPGMSKHGASTITQQVVKNITGEKEKSLKRKIQEQWRALELERKLSKDQILDIYLNLIFMGENCYGVQAASKTYFNKDVKDLTLGESASLAGITNLPAAYDPFLPNGKENNLKRQKIILKEMLGLGFITQQQYEEAKNETILFSTKSNSSVAFQPKNVQPYFVDQVVTDVKKDLMSKGYSENMAIKTIYNNGLKIYTTMDTKIQKAMDEAFTNNKYFSNISASGGTPQGSMVIIDPKNGHIRALYGGSGVKKGSGLNRASSPLMQRQPGSTFKPIAVYGPAINEHRITASTVVDDIPMYMLGTSNGRYPENVDHGYRGLTTVHNAIKYSINTVAAKVWRDFLGPDLSIKYLKRVNISIPNEKYVSVALGGLNKGVNPLQMAAAYVPFANKGLYFEPITYTKVEDAKGNVILQKKSKKSVVYDEATAFILTNMMKSVVKGGTGYPNGLIQGGQMPSAGKTGTTSDNKDKWFVGYTPYYVGAVWYGYDKPTPIPGYGSAAWLWHDIMEKVHKDLKVADFSLPSTLVKKSICIYSGKLAGDLCSHDPRQNSIIDEYFISGTEPTQFCDVHEKLRVCTESTDVFGRPLLAGNYCPQDKVIYRVFVKRKTPYYPLIAGDPYPSDYKYEAISGEYCTIHTSPIASESSGIDFKKILETPAKYFKF